MMFDIFAKGFARHIEAAKGLETSRRPARHAALQKADIDITEPGQKRGRARRQAVIVVNQYQRGAAPRHGPADRQFQTA